MLPSDVSIMWEDFATLPRPDFEAAWNFEYILMRTPEDDKEGVWTFMNVYSNFRPKVDFIDSSVFAEMKKQLPSFVGYRSTEMGMADLFTVNDRDFMILKLAYR